MQQRARAKQPPTLIGVAAVAVVALILIGLHLLNRPDQPGAPGAPGATGAAQTTVATGKSGLPTVRVGSLPPEARHTVQLIATGGPFPYPKDGVTFANREGLLPRQASGYYREYTVVTPGSSDRGARRVIAGRGGEEFYTEDHYASFQEIVP